MLIGKNNTPVEERPGFSLFLADEEKMVSFQSEIPGSLLTRSSTESRDVSTRHLREGVLI